MNGEVIALQPEKAQQEPEAHDAPEEKTSGLECRHGKFVFPDDYYIGAALKFFGEYSELETQFLISLVKPGDVVVEAGAHIGTITVPLAKAVGETGKVFAFEPQANINDMLRINVGLNDIGTWVDVTEAVIGATAGLMRYNRNPRNTGGVDFGADGELSAEVVTLDSYELDRLDLLKADVEGMERDVLLGTQATILRCRPVIYLENDRPLKTRAVLDLLFSMGYRVWRHEPWMWNPNNFRGVAENPWPGIAALNIVALPAEKYGADNDLPPALRGLKEIKPGQWAAVCRFGGVGDNLIAAAVFSGLVRQGNRVEVISNKHAAAVFENNPYVEKISICKDGDQPNDGGKLWQGWFEKRSHEYDGRLFHLSHSCEATLAFVEAQTQFWWRPEMRRALANKSYLEMVADICGSGYDFYPLFYPTGLEMAKAIQTKEKVGKRAVAWVICGSRFDKIYPYSSWAIARIIKELGVPVIMFGAPKTQDYEIAKTIQRDVEKQNGTLAGLHLAMTAEKTTKESNDFDPSAAAERGESGEAQWPLRRSLAQVLTCDLVITPDTGLAWACALEQCRRL